MKRFSLSHLRGAERRLAVPRAKTPRVPGRGLSAPVKAWALRPTKNDRRVERASDALLHPQQVVFPAGSSASARALAGVTNHYSLITNHKSRPAK